MGYGGCLEALQQQASAFGVDGVVGDAHSDLGKGDLDGAAAAERREGESGFGVGGAGVAGRRARRGMGGAEMLAAGGGRGAAVGGGVVAGRGAGRVMLVADLLAAEGERAAAMAGGMEMRAAELRIGDGGT